MPTVTHNSAGLHINFCICKKPEYLTPVGFLRPFNKGLARRDKHVGDFKMDATVGKALDGVTQSDKLPHPARLAEFERDARVSCTRTIRHTAETREADETDALSPRHVSRIS